MSKRFIIDVCHSNAVSLLQVLGWLDDHGNVFLDKNTAVGKNLQRALQLQRNHDHFEKIADVSNFEFLPNIV